MDSVRVDFIHKIPKKTIYCIYSKKLIVLSLEDKISLLIERRKVIDYQ